MGLGAIFWGVLGEYAGLAGTIFAAGLGGCVIALLMRAVQLPAEIDDPSASALTVPPDLSIATEMAPLLHSARHRLRAAVSYLVDPSDAAAFRAAMSISASSRANSTTRSADWRSLTRRRVA